MSSMIAMTSDRFRITMDMPDVGEEYQRYFQQMARRVRLNLVKDTLEVWFIHTKEGPSMEFIKWWSSQSTDIHIDEIFKDEVNRKLKCLNCTMDDHQLVYDYGSTEVMTHYIKWNFTQFKEL